VGESSGVGPGDLRNLNLRSLGKISAPKSFRGLTLDVWLGLKHNLGGQNGDII
jgi:hypothetical protein